MTVPLAPSGASKAPEAQPLLPQTHDARAQRAPRGAYGEAVGLALMAFSTVGYSFMTVLIRLAERRHHFPPASSVLLRGVLHTAAAALLLAFVFDASPAQLSPLQRRLLLLRGAIGACGMLCLYHSLNYIAAGEMISIFSFSPIITMALSHFVLGELVTRLDIFSAVLGLCGVFLISQPPSAAVAPSHLFGSALAFCGACFASTGYVCVRRMGTNVHFMLSVLSLSIFCVVASAVIGQKHALLSIFTNVSGSLVVVLASLFAFLGQCCLNKGLQLCRAGPGVIMRNLDVPIVYIVAIFLLGEHPDALRLFGSSLVVVATVIVGAQKFFSG